MATLGFVLQDKDLLHPLVTEGNQRVLSGLLIQAMDVMEDVEVKIVIQGVMPVVEIG